MSQDTTSPIHPSAAELRAFNLGCLTDEKALAIGTHLDRCPACCQALRQLPAEDPFVGRVRAAADGTGPFRPRGTARLPERLGDYRLLREIGRGGMGIVYEAEQVSLGRRVALKVFPPELLFDPKRKRRFEREARSAARLHHTNIVPVFGVGEHDGLPYYAMQFIQGLGLDEVLEEVRSLKSGSGPKPGAPDREVAATEVARSLVTGAFQTADAVPPTDPSDSSSPPVLLSGSSSKTPASDVRKRSYWHSVARIGVQVADALAYAHKQGILHRDIKPSNLLLDTHGTVWVADFGLAKADDQQDLTHSGDLLGTLRYMPPEAFEGKSDARGDVYALGLTLYELLALRPAFDEKERTRLIKQVTQADAVRLDRVNRAISRDLVTIVHKASDPEPAHRYRTALELAADLQRFLDDEPIRARRVSVRERVLRWARRNTAAAAALGALALILVAVTIVSSIAAVGFGQLAGEKETARVAALRASDEERRQRYRATIAAAANALQLHNISSARCALEIAPMDFRNWEWYHLNSQVDNARWVVGTLENGFAAVALSPDGKRVAGGGLDGSVCVWDTATGKEVRVVPGQNFRPVDSLAFTPDGRRLFVYHGGGTLRSWDLVGTNDGTALPVCESLGGSAFSPDARRLGVCAQEGAAGVWDLETGKAMALFPAHGEVGHTAVTLAPDGGRFAYPTGDRAIHLWDLAAGAEAAVLRGHRAIISAMAFSPDGKRFASGAQFPDNTARLWDAATGELIAVLAGHQNHVTAVAFSPDGALLGTASMDQTVRLWDGVTGKPLATMRGHTGWVNEAAFSPDGKRLVTASGDQTLRMWDTANGELVAVLRGHTGSVRGLRFSRDGALLASASEDGTVRLWDMGLVERNGVLRGHTSFVYDVAFSPDGSRVASAAWDGTVRTWDATTGLQTGLLNQPGALLTSVAYRPNGKQIASVSRDDAVSLWDPGAAAPAKVLPVPTRYWAIDCRAVFQPQGKLLASGSKDGSIRLWDTVGIEPPVLLKGHQSAVGDVAFRPDGTQLASAGEDMTVRLWDVATREEVGVLRGHKATVGRVAWSHDGRLLASASADKTVRLWDAGTQQPLAVLSPGSIVYGVAFSPDGGRLAAGCADNTIRLWDVAAGEEVAELRGHESYVHAVAFSPDGTRLVSGSGDFTVRVWDTLPPAVRARPKNAEHPPPE
jgi:eukaryotic-like serine/threonine-protein kinase